MHLYSWWDFFLLLIDFSVLNWIWAVLTVQFFRKTEKCTEMERCINFWQVSEPPPIPPQQDVQLESPWWPNYGHDKQNLIKSSEQFGKRTKSFYSQFTYPAGNLTWQQLQAGWNLCQRNLSGWPQKRTQAGLKQLSQQQQRLCHSSAWWSHTAAAFPHSMQGTTDRHEDRQSPPKQTSPPKLWIHGPQDTAVSDPGASHLVSLPWTQVVPHPCPWWQQQQAGMKNMGWTCLSEGFILMPASSRSSKLLHVSSWIPHPFQTTNLLQLQSISQF